MIDIEPEDIEGFGSLSEVEKSTALRFCDAATASGIAVRRVRRGGDPPDLVVVADGADVGIELKRLSDPSISEQNAWLDRVHALLEQAALPAEVGYEPIGQPRVSSPDLVAALTKAVAAVRADSQANEGRCDVRVAGTPILHLWWSRRAGMRHRVVRNAVYRSLDGMTVADLWTFLRSQAAVRDRWYAGNDGTPWWLVLHDENEMLTEPFFDVAFAEYLETAAPLRMRVFRRVMLMGRYYAALKRYPLLDLPVVCAAD